MCTNVIVCRGNYANNIDQQTKVTLSVDTCNTLMLAEKKKKIHAVPDLIITVYSTCCLTTLTWRVPFNDWMVVHLESGVATTACEAHNMVLAIIYNGGGLIDCDVICSHIEDDSHFSIILQVKDSPITGKETLKQLNRA